MRRKLKGFILGFLIGAIIFGFTGAYAAEGSLIEVFYNVDNIVIDGISKMPSENKPLIHNGNIYVPLKFISESFGKEVSWDGTNRTIYINGIEKDKIAIPGYNIDPISTQSNNKVFTVDYSYDSKALEDNLGNSYDSYITYTSYYYDGKAYTEYVTNTEYKTFTAIVGLTDNEKDTYATGKFRVYADDKEVYSKTIQSGDLPEEISVDISNAIKVKLETTVTYNSDSVFDSFQLGVFNPKFMK